MYYFVRPNGNSAHANPADKTCYVVGEPSDGSLYPYFNYARFCLERGFIRIGWPDTGDLTSPTRAGKRANCYTLESIASYKRDYLESFIAISKGATVLMPDQSVRGCLYIGTVTGPYYYKANPPEDPYECAHRLPVDWDTNGKGNFRPYDAESLGAGLTGGFWRRAFADLSRASGGEYIIKRIREERGQTSDV